MIPILVQASKPLPHPEQTALCVRAQRGDRAAREKLIKSCLRFVWRLARKRLGVGASSREKHLDDLFNVGVMGALGTGGLNRAIDLFDPSSGNNFLTYAHFWVRQGMDRYLQEEESIVHTPVAYAILGKQIERRRRTWAAAGLTDAEVEGKLRAEFGELSFEAVGVRKARRVELDKPSPSSRGGDSTSRHDWMQLTLEDDADGALDAEQKAARIRAVVAKVRAKLTPRFAHVLDRRLAPHGLSPHSSPRERDRDTTLHDVGIELGVTRERVRQMETRVRRQLRAELAQAFPEEVAARDPDRKRAPAASKPQKTRLGKTAPEQVKPVIRSVPVSVTGVRVGDVVPSAGPTRQTALTIVWPCKRLESRKKRAA